MTVNPIHGQGGPPAQITGTQSKSGEEAFNDFTKSRGFNSADLTEEVDKRTKLTRTKRAGGKNVKNSSLFLVSYNGEMEEEAIYRTVMVDGVLFTLRLLAVA